MRLRFDRGTVLLLDSPREANVSDLPAKLERLREARIANLVLCIDEERNVGPSDLPTSARVVRYRRRVDPSAVLRAIRGE